MSLQGRTIALAEGRQLEELAAMLEKEGAKILRCPMVSILDSDDCESVVAWLRRLIAAEFTYIVLFTGEGLRRLLGFAERESIRDEFIAALGKLKIIARGPKPVRALKEIGLGPFKVAVAPTTDGVIETLKQESLSGLGVGVQLYSESNLPLTEYLAYAGARVHTVLPYVYAPAADSTKVVDLVERMAAGQVDCIVFTSSPQVDRLVEVAKERGIEDTLRIAWTRTRIAAVGPLVKERLNDIGARAHIVPEQGFQMKNLVQHIKRAFQRNTPMGESAIN
jgi:uroporphyrinogen-III synthase